jgi:pectate lyase-like protein
VKILVEGEEAAEAISVTGGQQSRVIDVTAGTVFAVNGQTGNVQLRGLTGWINAADAPYNAARDGIGDPTAAIQAAIDACPPGGLVYLPAGEYATTETLDLKNGVSLASDHASLMTGPGMTGNEYPCRIKPAASFTGDSVIQIIGDADGTHPNISGEQRLTNLLIDGANIGGSSVDGLYARGNVQNVVLDNVTIKNMPNNGIVTAPRSLDGQYPYSWRMRHVIIDTCHSSGFLFTLMTDLTAVDCQAIGCFATGWSLTNMPNSQLIACRAEWSGNNGIHITGDWGSGTGSGGIVLTGCTTDRNGFNGILIDATGNGPVQIDSLATRRDGRNGGDGGGGYAALNVDHATMPVLVGHITCYPGIDDTGTASNSPQYGARFTGNTYVSVASGFLHADTAGWSDGGGNAILRRGPNVGERTGTTDAPTDAFANPWGAAGNATFSGYTALDAGQSNGQWNIWDGTAKALNLGSAGGGVAIKEGANARMGVATLNGTTAVTIANTSVTVASRIQLTIQAPGGTPGSPYVFTRTAGTSFQIKSTSASDTSTVAWMLVEPA